MPAEKTKRNASKRSTPKSAAPKSAAQGVFINDALAEAAWSGADAALAQALADLDEAETATTKADREDALARLSEALTRAGRKRGLGRTGELGADMPFDPETFALNAVVAKTPKTVRIQSRGVTRGDEVLERPRVAPVTRKRRS